MKILWLNGRPETNPGGTEQHTVDFVRALKQIKWIDLYLAVAKDSFADIKIDLEKKIYVRFRSELAPLSTFRLIREVLKIRPDFIIANNGNEYLNALASAKAAGSKLILFRHMVARQPFLLKKIVFPRVHRILAVSEYVKEFLVSEEGVEPDKVEVVYNFIDPDEFNYSEERRKEVRRRLSFKDDDVVLLFCGKVEKGKGIYEFIETFKSLRKKYKNLRAIVVGGGSKLEEVKRIFKGDKRVLILGPREHVAEFFIASDIFLMPTHANESFGRTIIEAFATKTAVVAFAVGNIPYLITHNLNGFLAEKGNVKTLIELTDKLIKNQNLRKSFEEEAYNTYIRKFHRDNVLKTFVEVLSL